jgi:hypothetical protein
MTAQRRRVLRVEFKADYLVGVSGAPEVFMRKGGKSAKVGANP